MFCWEYTDGIDICPSVTQVVRRQLCLNQGWPSLATGQQTSATYHVLQPVCLISVAFLLSKWMYRYCSIVLNQSSDITAANIAQIMEWFKLGPARACQDQKTNKCSHFCLQRSMASSIQLTCLTVLSNNLFPGPLWSWTLNFILHAFLHPIIIIFSQHVPIPTQPVLLQYQCYVNYT